MTQLISGLHHPSIRPTPSALRLKKDRRKSAPVCGDTSQVSTVIQGLLYLRDGLNHDEREEIRAREERKQILTARMITAESLDQWDNAADELDIIEGHDQWKADDATGDYNPSLIEDRLRQLDEARANCDMRAMMHLVRTSLSRDLGGMGNIDLYRHSHRGTKKLVERYVDSALQTISYLVENSSVYNQDDTGPRDLLDSMLFARQGFGRSALMLSGGGTFGMSHIGVLKALWQAKLLPRIISGASAGSIVCSIFCCRTDDEVPDLVRDFPHGDLAVFEEEGNEEGILDHVTRLLTEGNWSDISHLTRVMRDHLGDITFQEAYNRTRKICNITVSSASIYELPRLLNYVTAPNVMIWSAVAASCSVPFIFSAGQLLAKNPFTGEHTPWNPTPQMWIDGSVDNDLPMTRLAEMFNVNHFIVSQVNPHVTPFLLKDETPSSFSHGKIYRDEGDWMSTLTSLAKSEALHRMQSLAEIGIFPNLVTKLRSILSQKYSGDINILPALGVLDLPMILKNPTTDYMLRLCLLGERATWPKLARIRDRCAIELALDRAVHSLRARVVFSQSQVDLRRMATGTMPSKLMASHGSHEPLASSKQSTSHSALNNIRAGRRSSVGNLLSDQQQRELAVQVQSNCIDDDSGDEERLEMTIRHNRSGKAKMRLRRPSRGQPLQTGPMSSPILSSGSEDYFDMPRSLTLSHAAMGSALPTRPSSHLATVQSTDGTGRGHYSTDTASMTSPHHTANETELETTDLHSSDADVDSHTDDDATALGSPQPGMGDISGDGWLRRVSDHSINPSPAFKQDMFSMSRRERDERRDDEDSVDPGAGLWG